MRIRHSKSPIPRRFSDHPAGGAILAEADIGLSKHARLRCKLLVFKTPTALRRFWRDALGRGELGRGCAGCVSALACQITSFRNGIESAPYVEADPRYFCVIGLTQGNLSMEVISHESTHAGFAHAKRHKGDFWTDASEMGEESICYPAGRIAAAINRFLNKHGLYK